MLRAIESFFAANRQFVSPTGCCKAIPISGHDNSSGKITLTDQGFSAAYYNNTIGGNTTVFYEWDTVSRLFVPIREVDEFNNSEESAKGWIRVMKILGQQSGEYRIISRENYRP